MKRGSNRDVSQGYTDCGCLVARQSKHKRLDYTGQYPLRWTMVYLQLDLRWQVSDRGKGDQTAIYSPTFHILDRRVESQLAFRAVHLTMGFLRSTVVMGVETSDDHCHQSTLICSACALLCSLLVTHRPSNIILLTKTADKIPSHQ